MTEYTAYNDKNGDNKQVQYQISACNIVISFNDGKGEKYKYTFPTDFEKIDVESGFMEYSEASITMWFSQRGSDKKKSWYFLDKSTPTSEIKKIEKAIHHLNSFCKSEDLF
ncbi:hypothetical protein MK137Hg34_000050800 [Viscerimonas tarda]